MNKLQCPSAAQRGYGARWQKARKAWLEANPWCVYCTKAGKKQRASHVDHIVPHKGDHALFWNNANWQSLCFHHHNTLALEPKKCGPTVTQA